MRWSHEGAPAGASIEGWQRGWASRCWACNSKILNSIGLASPDRLALQTPYTYPQAFGQPGPPKSLPFSRERERRVLVYQVFPGGVDRAPREVRTSTRRIEKPTKTDVFSTFFRLRAGQDGAKIAPKSSRRPKLGALCCRSCCFGSGATPVLVSAFLELKNSPQSRPQNSLSR